MDLFLAEYGLVAAPIHEIQDTKLIAQMVEANFGIGLVTENFIQDDLESGKVYKIPVIEKFPVRDVTLAWRKSRVERLFYFNNKSLATCSADSSPSRCSSIANPKSKTSPGPRPVMIKPSVTRRQIGRASCRERV